MFKQKFLMWNPKHFDVTYDINNHMTGNIGKVNKDEALLQWSRLKNILSIDNIVIDAYELAKNFNSTYSDMPDIVFTANAGLIYKNKVIISNFSKKERMLESYFYKMVLDNYLNYEIIKWPNTFYFEGAGDALFDNYGIEGLNHYSINKKILWVGYGFRTEEASVSLIQYIFSDIIINGLKLIDPYFYHLDTCFCPLEDGYLMYYPMAFDKDSLSIIKDYIPETFRIEVSREDALNFCCNAVTYNKTIVMNDCSYELFKKLSDLEFTVIRTPMTEFIKAGGSAKCLTLPLIES